MQNITSFVLGATLMTLLCSCEGMANRLVEKAMDKAFELDTVKWGPIQYKTLDLCDFHALDVAGSAQVFYEQDSAYSVEMEVCEKAMDKYALIMDDGELEVKLQGEKSMKITKSTPGIVLHIKAPRLDEYDISGACELHLLNTVDIPGEVEMDCKGAAHIYIDSLCCKNFELDCAGAANVNVKNLVCEGLAKVDISGAARMDVNLCSGKTDIEVNGAGEVNISGKTNHLKKEVNGVAKLNTDSLIILQ